MERIIARNKIKYGGQYYEPGQVVPAELKDLAPHCVQIVALEEIGEALQSAGVDSDQCDAPRKDGERCRNDAVPGTQFCRVHQPKE